MSRPRKCRRVWRLPENNEFIPVRGPGKEIEPVIITVEEYETIRLIDGEYLSQEQCSEQMEVARTTVQQMYDSARKKVAKALVEGRIIRIEGGHYELCLGREKVRGHHGCHGMGRKRRCEE